MTIENLPVEATKSSEPNTLELLKAIRFKPQTLIWENFHDKQPEPDRWVYLWCPFGKMAQNIIVTYRDIFGHYDLPHPTKKFPVHAWAYADNPTVEEKNESIAE